MSSPHISRRSFFKAIPVAVVAGAAAEDLFMPVYEAKAEEPKPHVIQHFLRFDFWPARSYPSVCDMRTLEQHYRPETEIDFRREHGVDIRSEMLKHFVHQCGFGLYQVTEGVVLSNYEKQDCATFRFFYDGHNHWAYPLDHWVIRAVHDFDVRTSAGSQDELNDRIIEFLTGER